MPKAIVGIPFLHISCLLCERAMTIQYVHIITYAVYIFACNIMYADHLHTYM